jgi:hypothetical protein
MNFAVQFKWATSRQAHTVTLRRGLTIDCSEFWESWPVFSSLVI